jgi:hypothetical protein
MREAVWEWTTTPITAKRFHVSLKKTQSSDFAFSNSMVLLLFHLLLPLILPS